MLEMDLFQCTCLCFLEIQTPQNVFHHCRLTVVSFRHQVKNKKLSNTDEISCASLYRHAIVTVLESVSYCFPRQTWELFVKLKSCEFFLHFARMQLTGKYGIFKRFFPDFSACSEKKKKGQPRAHGKQSAKIMITWCLFMQEKMKGLDF